MLPVADVCLLEDCSGGGLRIIGVIGYKLLSFGAKSQVCEDDVAMLGKESTGKGEIDS